MRTALIIDDDDNSRNALSELLMKESFTVEWAEDGWEGVTRLKKSAYDIVLLDVRMPNIDGEQVLTIVSKFSKPLPVIIVSAYLTKERVVRLKNLGAKGFLTKPISVKNFYSVIRQVCPPEKPQEESTV